MYNQMMGQQPQQNIWGTASTGGEMAQQAMQQGGPLGGNGIQMPQAGRIDNTPSTGSMVKKAGGAALGKHAGAAIGNAMMPGIGGVIGGAMGSAFGGK